MTPEEIAELRIPATLRQSMPNCTVLRCLNEIERLRGWLEKIEGEAAWWDDMEEWSHAALAGEEVPS